MAFDATSAGVGNVPGYQSWGTAALVPLPTTKPKKKKKPYAFKGKPPAGSTEKNDAGKNTGAGGSGATQSSPSSSPAASTTSTQSGKTAAQRRAEARKRAEERAAAEAAKRNPLTAPFKTPNELRAEAARLAALGAVSEESLRTESAAQQADISGLTTGLSGRLAGLSNEYQAGLRGLASAYTGLAGQAQQTGESLAAAAGAPSGLAPGASPTVATTMAALGAVPATYAPAAEMRGAMLGGEARAALTKALADRASKISADTAKYLYQLRDDELQRAIAQETSAQNLARLGLSQESQAWDQQMDVAGLNLRQQSLSLQAQRLANQIAKDAASASSKGAKNIQSVKNRILFNVGKFTAPKQVNSGTYEFKFSSPAGDLSAVGSSADDAWQNAINSGQVASETRYTTFTQGGEIKKDVAPNNEDVIKALQPSLVNAGMKPKAARAWILKNVLNVTPSVSSVYAPSGSVR